MTDEEKMIIQMTSQGFTVDVNDDKRIGFVKYVDENTEWMMDYIKKTRSCIMMNGRTKINLIVKNPDK